MSKSPQGKTTKRKRSVARDLTAKKTTRLTGGIVTDNKHSIVYNGHAGLGANEVVASFKSASGLKSETE